MQAFSDCLWRGFLIIVYCDLSDKKLISKLVTHAHNAGSLYWASSIFITAQKQNMLFTASGCGVPLIMPHLCTSGTKKLSFRAFFWGIVFFCTTNSSFRIFLKRIFRIFWQTERKKMNYHLPLWHVRTRDYMVFVCCVIKQLMKHHYYSLCS